MTQRTQEEIVRLKEKYKDYDEYEKNGSKYLRFVIHKLDIPDYLKHKFFTVKYDDDDNAYLVRTIPLGLDPKERKKREKLRQETKEKNRKLRAEKVQQRREIKRQIKQYAKEMNFSKCEELKKQLEDIISRQEL